MPALDDDVQWGLPGGRLAPPLDAAERRASTPLRDLLGATDPEADAVVGRDGRLSHGRLLALATRTANAVATSVPAGAAVACILPRGAAAAAGLLGCAMSGRLCLALDDLERPERLATLLEDARPDTVLAPAVPPFAHPGRLLTLAEALAGPDGTLTATWDPEAPMIAHYTSGSTGRPKGIVFSARASLYRALHAAQAWGVTPDDVVLAPMHPAGSAGFTTMLAALSGGARFVMADLASAGAGALLQLAVRERVTCASIPAPILRTLLRLDGAAAAFANMRALRVGSAALSRDDLAALRRLLPAGCSILHTYSSTEAPVIAQRFVPAGEVGDDIAVAAGALQASHEYGLGEDGELVLRSRYVALGEWQGGRLATGRMPAVPGRPGWRLLRTGDRVRIDADGLLRVLGRVDRQVKINAVRVEPAEIEAVLRTQPGVAEAAVVATSGAGGVALHGFVAAPGADPAALAAALRRRLAARLPPALRPARLTVLERLPTLPGGKPDLAALTRLAAG